MTTKQNIPQNSKTFINTTISLKKQQQTQLKNKNIIIKNINPLNSKQQHKLQQKQTSSPLQLLPINNQINLQQQTHIKNIQNNITILKHKITNPSNQKNQKIIHINSNTKQI